ncbi:hypothetical protein DVH24_029939 [Malus domestica]|uniref:LIM zinc-binding domain-containing protein n=1 Tax=Malus domestica TaxID=3750 RepID=A0A498HUE5_MALDO|nr:hypothetical protein DVH24_029939 [Malus domestica]
MAGLISFNWIVLIGTGCECHKAKFRWFVILKGSSHKGHSHKKFREDRAWDEPRNSVEEDIDVAIALSLSELDQKGKNVIEDESQSEDDEQPAKVESHDDEQSSEVESDDDERSAEVESDDDVRSAKVQSDDDENPAKFHYEEDEQSAKVQLEEDEQLAKAIQESLNMGSPPRHDNGNISQPFSFFTPAGYRTCAGCKSGIGHGRYLSCMGAVWHPECFRCRACNLPITDYEVRLWFLFSKNFLWNWLTKYLNSQPSYF